MDTRILESIGLTHSESKVYLALLELGSTTKGPVVKESGVASSKVYELLDKLIEKGLASYVIKSGTKYFEAAPPSRILDYIKERESEIKTQERRAKEMIPTLERMQSMAGMGSETQVFKGMKGAVTCFNDILKELKKGEEYYVLGVSKINPNFERFVLGFHRKRAKLGIKCKFIINESKKELGKKYIKFPHTKVSVLSKDLFTPVVFVVYKDKTMIAISLNEIFIQIKSKNLADGLRAYAKYMFSVGKRI